ncbi:MAG: peptidylprolyl isomerase [Candidatus Aenigmatarchaeota archaeon]
MKNGDFVKISYVGRIKETNEIFDLTDEEVAKKEKIYNPKAMYGPVTIIIGEKMILPALEDEIKNLKPGEKKTFDVEFEKAFGARDARLIKVFNEAEFRKNDMNPIPGLTVNINGLHGKVLSNSGGRARVDFNHPLAGKALNYDLSVNEIVEKDDDKAKSILQYYAGVAPGTATVSIAGAQVTVALPPKNQVPPEAKEKAASEIMKWLTNATSVKYEEIYKKKA